MRIKRIDHSGVIVDDLAAAKAFFLAFGLEAQGEADMEGELVDRLLGLRSVTTSLVMMRPPGGEASIELIKFHSPADDNEVQLSVTAPGIRHIAFLVDDLDALVGALREEGQGAAFSAATGSAVVGLRTSRRVPAGQPLQGAGQPPGLGARAIPSSARLCEGVAGGRRRVMTMSEDVP